MDLASILFGLTLVVIPAIVIIAMTVVWAMKQRNVPPIQAQPLPAGAPPPPAPHVRPTYFNWTLSWSSSPFWKSLFTVAFLLVLAVLLYGLYTHNSGVQESLQGVAPSELLGYQIVGVPLSTIAVGLVILLILVAIVALISKIGIKLPKAGTTPAQVLTSFLVFALVLYAMYGVSPQADLFTTPEGWVTIAVYAVAMTVAAMVALNFKKGGWLTAVVGMFIFFALTGTRSWMLLNSDGVFAQRTHLASIGAGWNSGPSSNNRVVVVTPSTPQVLLGVRLSTTLGSTPVELNPGGRYKIWVHEVNQGQCVKVYGPSNQYLGDDCEGSVDLTDTAKFASARGDLVKIEYILSPY